MPLAVNELGEMGAGLVDAPKACSHKCAPRSDRERRPLFGFHW